MSEHVNKAKDFFTLDEDNLRYILIVKSFAPFDVIIVIELLIARERVIRMKRKVEIRARINN